MNPAALLNSIFVIARNTFREAVRDRVLYNLVVFVLLITASAIFLSELSAGQEKRIIINLGLSAMLIFGAFIAIFVGVGLVSKEIEKRTLYTIFSKPIGRGTFLVGKYLGLCLTLLVNIAIMGIGLSLALLYVGGGDFAGTIWGAVVLIFLELAILTAVAILFSTFSSPALSALLTFLVFIIGHSSTVLLDSAEKTSTGIGRILLQAIYYMFPNLSLFSFISNSAHGDFPPAAMIGIGIMYAIVYIAVMMAISILIFSRRNLK